MLKHRVITAVILIPIFVFLVLKLSPFAFFVLTSMVVLWGGCEWSAFLGFKTFLGNILYPIILGFFLVFASMLSAIVILNIAVVWWLIALGLILMYPRAPIWGKSILLRAIMGFFVLIPCWAAINYIRNVENGQYILLFLFVLIWGADIGAFFVGRKWGKHKLAPSVSPGKTWEGLLGALVVTILITVGILFVQKTPGMIWLPAILLSIFTVLFSIVGDLFESMLKRNVGLKDSGHLLPGHGGLLDRIDSLTAAAPIFAAGATFLGNFFH